jgi:FkbM family methyltransferase
MIARLNPYPVVLPFAEHSRLLAWKGLTGATGNLYCGLDEYEDMAFILHFLREGDQFVDVGANIGSYAVLAGSEVGADVIAVEPVPDTFKTLQDNIGLNGLTNKVRALNLGLGGSNRVLRFTHTLDTTNHVATEEDHDTIEVQIEQFDRIVRIDRVTVVKIDVEGYETEVLRGMEGALRDPNVMAIVLELNGSGERYGYDEDALRTKLITSGFSPIHYSPCDRRLETSGRTSSSNNSIYIRDVEYARRRVMSARRYRVLDQAI